MRGGVAFSDILQEKLDVHLSEEAPTHTPAGFPMPPPLGFFPSYLSPRTYSHGHVSPRRWQPPVRPRPRRTLMPHEQRALGYLVSLGARLEADFTEAELRTAFRMLAREYHPDRHPNGSPQQTERLTALFRRLRQAYEDLQGAAANN
jgi:hypothetical protein